MDDSRRSIYQQRSSGGVTGGGKPSKFKVKRRQTFHSQHRHGGMFSTPPMHFEVAELIRKPASNLSVPRIIPQQQRGSSSSSIAYGSTKHLARPPQAENRSFLTVAPPSRPSSVESIQQRRPSCNSTSSTGDTSGSYKQRNYLCPIADLGSAKARIPTPELLSSDTSPALSSNSRSASISSYGRRDTLKEEKLSVAEIVVTEDLDVQSVINERRPSKLKPVSSTPLGTYGHLYVKEESVDVPLTSVVTAEGDEEEEEDEDERRYVSVGVGPSSVELRIFVDETDDEPRAEHQEETQVGRHNGEAGTGDGGIRRKKSPARDDTK